MSFTVKENNLFVFLCTCVCILLHASLCACVHECMSMYICNYVLTPALNCLVHLPSQKKGQGMRGPEGLIVVRLRPYFLYKTNHRQCTVTMVIKIMG